mmetsp:Transcript_27716/g.74978  ORF Transcript_27716/g.74978 Transcript_27716/m.74978 type:complete len:318 (-) Transcript_27716:303-1256(-)
MMAQGTVGHHWKSTTFPLLWPECCIMSSFGRCTSCGAVGTPALLFFLEASGGKGRSAGGASTLMFHTIITRSSPPDARTPLACGCHSKRMMASVCERREQMVWSGPRSARVSHTLMLPSCAPVATQCSASGDQSTHWMSLGPCASFMRSTGAAPERTSQNMSCASSPTLASSCMLPGLNTTSSTGRVWPSKRWRARNSGESFAPPLPPQDPASKLVVESARSHSITRQSLPPEATRGAAGVVARGKSASSSWPTSFMSGMLSCSLFFFSLGLCGCLSTFHSSTSGASVCVTTKPGCWGISRILFTSPGWNRTFSSLR